MTSVQDYIDTIELLWPSLVTGAAVAGAASAAGVFVLLRRQALVALAVPQAVGLGAAVGMRLNWPTLPPAIASVAAALGLLSWSRWRGQSHLMLPAAYIACLCGAFLIIANSGQHVADLQNLFTGMDVAVTVAQAAVTAPLLIVVMLLIALLWRRWLLMAQSPSIAQLAGLHPARWDAFFLSLLALVIVLGTSALGSVFVIVMLLLPAGSVLPWTRRVPTALITSIACAMVLLVAGFVLSIEMAWPLSQSIGGAGACVFLLSSAGAAVRGA